MQLKDKIFQNVQNLSFWKKIDAIYEKNLKHLKIFWGSKFAVECIWNNQIRQNVQNLVNFRKNTWNFLKISFCFFGNH